ncbi:MAG: hypothetical protein HFI19_00605 [Lachnospiraceae bacterium]|uniref:hypothetical protein n=1 Tax=Candidatus Merdisoma sp. JLR.KK006 TaxID=3112626 RepID=UPI002FF24679|nr:hypothetical protein [Lachnospiraceae bacterium]
MPDGELAHRMASDIFLTWGECPKARLLLLQSSLHGGLYLRQKNTIYQMGRWLTGWYMIFF